MNVLTRSVPVPDDTDPSRSLREMYTYLFDLSEQIDYTLSRQGIQLGKVSLPATQEQVDKLTALTDHLNTTATALSAQLTALDNETAAAVELLTGQLDAVTAQQTALAATVTALEQRIAALEGANI